MQDKLSIYEVSAYQNCSESGIIYYFDTIKVLLILLMEK